jgi:glycosyltransferase AglD
MKMVDLSLFVPCYNEEKRLQKNITAIYHAMQNLGKTFELVIVDDGSRDSTSRIAKILASMYPEVLHLRYENGPSRRENLGIALRTARGSIVSFMDLDLSVPLSYLDQLITSVEKGNDISTGSRYKGQRAKRKFIRRIVSGVYNVFMHYYFGSEIVDHQCGFKAFKKEKLFVLLDAMGYDEKFVRGWFWDAELMIRAQRTSCVIDEFSVEWTFGKQSSFDFGRELQMLPYVLRLRFRI